MVNFLSEQFKVYIFGRGKMTHGLDRTAELKHLSESSKTILIQKQEIRWDSVFYMSFLHVCLFPGIYLAFTKALWATNLFAIALYVVSKIGVTAGVHRLWSHRSYKANLPLRSLLMIFFTLAVEGSVWGWSRNHRAHHKYQETDADPHNAVRGLWYSHVGWTFYSLHPECVEKRKTIDMSDLDNDAVVVFQKRYYWPLTLVITIFLPTGIPVYFWGESLLVAWMVAVVVRLVLGNHGTWCINSIAHTYGKRPYDKNLWARNNMMTNLTTLGDGWHNYHHTFPWDYRSSEMGFTSFNITKGFIDFFAKIGWAHDLKTVSPEMVASRALRTGDGTRTANGELEVWGWNDPDLSGEQRRAATIIRQKH